MAARRRPRLRVPLHQIKRPRSSDGVVIRQNSGRGHRFLHVILPNHLHRVVLQHKGKRLLKLESNLSSCSRVEVGRVAESQRVTRKSSRVESGRVEPSKFDRQGLRHDRGHRLVLHFCYRKISIRTAYGGTKAPSFIPGLL